MLYDWIGLLDPVYKLTKQLKYIDSDKKNRFIDFDKNKRRQRSVE